MKDQWIFVLLALILAVYLEFDLNSQFHELWYSKVSNLDQLCLQMVCWKKLCRLSIVVGIVCLWFQSVGSFFPNAHSGLHSGLIVRAFPNVSKESSWNVERIVGRTWRQTMANHPTTARLSCQTRHWMICWHELLELTWRSLSIFHFLWDLRAKKSNGKLQGIF